MAKKISLAEIKKMLKSGNAMVGTKKNLEKFEAGKNRKGFGKL